MHWVIYALLDLFGATAKAEVNRLYKLNHHKLNMSRTLFACLLITPTLFFIPPPSDSIFYIAALVVGVESIFSSLLLFHLSGKINGCVATLKKPVFALLLFFTWFIFDGVYRENLIAHPLHLSAIVFFIVLASFSFLGMQKNTNSTYALKLILPVALINTLSVVFFKFFLEHSIQSVYEMLWFYLFVMGVQTLYSGGILYLKNDIHIDDYLPHKAGIALAGVAGLFGMFGWYAMLLAPNPAYVKVIGLSTPIIIGLGYKIFGVRDDVSPIWGAVLVLSVIGIVVASLYI